MVAAWAVVFLLVAFALNTESGTRWVIAQVDDALPGTLQLEGIDGTIWQGLRVESLVYADEKQRLQIQELAFDLHWPVVITRELAFDNLTARVVRRENLQPRPESPEPFTLEMQPLPIPVSAKYISVGVLELVHGEPQQRFESIAVKKLLVDRRRITADEIAMRRDRVRATVTNPSLRLAGEVEASGDVRWEMRNTEWSGRGSMTGTLTQLAVQQQLDGPYPMNAEGEIYILNRVEPEFDARISWKQWLIAERPFTDGNIEVDGTLAQFSGSYQTTFENAGATYKLSGDAAGNLDALSSLTATLENEQVELDVTGSLTLNPELSAKGSAVARYVDPQLIHSKLQGALRASAEVEVDARGTLTAKNLLAEGDINDAVVSAGGDATLSADNWRCSDCILSVGQNDISLNGYQDGEQLRLSVSLDAPELSELWPGLIGSAVAEAEVQEDSGNLEIDWRYDDFSVSLASALQYDDQQIAGIVQSATAAEQALGSWDLQRPFGFALTRQGITLDSNEWQGELGSIRIAELGVTDGNFRILAEMQDVPLETGNTFLPENYQLSGSADAEVDLRFEAERWNGTASWAQRETTLRVVRINGDVSNVTVPVAKARAEFVDNRVVADGVVEVEPGVVGNLQFSLADLSPDAQLSGSLSLQGDDWSWITALVPEIDRFDGSISADIAAQGPLQAPAFSGSAKWLDGQVSIPSLNVRLSEIGVTVTGATDGDATVEGTARSGSGDLQISGQLQDLLQPTRRASFAITGNGARLANWPEYRVWGSPDIRLDGDFDAWHISGKLSVPRAEITPREVPVSAVTVSPDVVVLGESGAPVRRTRVTGETRLILGDDVEFSALGLETRLQGNILFKQPDGRPTSAEGRVTLVDGTYAMQGRKLQIEQGELVFTGPLDDPLVDVRAVRIIDDLGTTVKAGVHLRGRAQNLTTTVFSEPAMSDADALSYLVLGRALSQASDTEGGELSGAAVALGLRQVSRITDQVGQSIGVDELSLAGDGGDTTALVAGKQVNSRLYARYAYGVFSELGTLLLRYRLNRNVTLEAGAGENQSLDILYTIEK